MQKRQSVQLSQASVRLRELERDVEASRDVYQSFLKRSRETEEQESLNTSSARIIGEATVPQRAHFRRPQSLLAMIGLLFGALGAAAWIVAADRLSSDATRDRASAPARRKSRPPAPPSRPRMDIRLAPQPAGAPIEKPLIARLQESDVMRTLGGILAVGGSPRRDADGLADAAARLLADNLPQHHARDACERWRSDRPRMGRR